MIRPTFGMLRQTSLASSIGLCGGDIGAIAAAVNEAQERLIKDPMAPDEGWWGGSAAMAFNLQVSNNQAYVTTPREVARIILSDVCQKPVRIRNGFYEYLTFGRGLMPRGSGCDDTRQGYERDSVCTLSPLLSTPQTIRVYPTDIADVGKTVTISGLDSNGKPVLGVDVSTQQTALGEKIILQLPFADSTNQFSVINGIQKDVTIGFVTLTQVDPSTLMEAGLSSMDPGEQSGYYRRYFFDGLPSNCWNSTSGAVQLSVQAKLEMVPVQSDPDYLAILCIPAILEEVQANRYSRMDASNAPALEAKHHAAALRLLCGELDHYLGKTNTEVNVPIFGSDRLKRQPV